MSDAVSFDGWVCLTPLALGSACNRASAGYSFGRIIALRIDRGLMTGIVPRLDDSEQKR